jgi:opacity protein-like surface antigen
MGDQIRVMRSLLLILLLFLIPDYTGLAQNKTTSPAKFGIGLEIGDWRPSNLSDDLTFTPLKNSRHHPYVGIMLLKPWRWGMTFRSSLGYWKYCNYEPYPDKKAIKIGSILLDLKYAILSDVMLMPYVSYGMGWFFGNESKSKQSFFNNTNGLELGIGINVGTGFDFKFTRKFNLAMEFRYHYVKFKRVVAFTDNYSGPKISIGMIYLF